MTGSKSLSVESRSLPYEAFQHLIDALARSGYRVIGPRVRDEAIVYEEIDSVDQLPRGYRDEQRPGRYRLSHSDQEDYFSFTVGPQSWKQFLFPPKTTVATSKRTDGRWEFSTTDQTTPKYAFLGVRACEMAAIEIQDRVFLNGPYIDPDYAARRKDAFLIAVNCTTASSTCFCTSMGTGPRNESSFDLALTEIRNAFVLEVGSDRGQEIADQLGLSPATDNQLAEAESKRGDAIKQIERFLETDGIRDRLLGSLNHPQWDDVASRCLSCTNCTMVCPTCFCSSVTEVSDLQESEVERVRQWDSCFDESFSYTAGGTIHNETRSRYRQWLTHKFASWHDQFGTSGCVGCGRCITWCPVGIDVTEEVHRITRPAESRRSLPIVKPIEGAACTVKELDR